MKCIVSVFPIKDQPGQWLHISECGRRFKLPTEVPISINCPAGLCYADDAPQLFPLGVGTALARLLHRLGIKACLKCSYRMALMNGWGVAGCKERREVIVGWLREAYKQTPKLKRSEAVAKAISTGIVYRLCPWRLFDSLLDEAIRLAEASTSGSEAASSPVAGS